METAWSLWCMVYTHTLNFLVSIRCPNKLPLLDLHVQGKLIGNIPAMFGCHVAR